MNDTDRFTPLKELEEVILSSNEDRTLDDLKKIIDRYISHKRQVLVALDETMLTGPKISVDKQPDGLVNIVLDCYTSENVTLQHYEKTGEQWLCVPADMDVLMDAAKGLVDEIKFISVDGSIVVPVSMF